MTGAMKFEVATPRAENLGHRAVLEKTPATSRTWRILASPNIIIPQNAQAQVADSLLIFSSSLLPKPSKARKSTFSFAREPDHASFSATANTLLSAHLERETLILIAAFSRPSRRPLPSRFLGIPSKTIKKKRITIKCFLKCVSRFDVDTNKEKSEIGLRTFSPEPHAQRTITYNILQGYNIFSSKIKVAATLMHQ
jgi:hypothetical protein